ncbi:MAG: hypothetical protein O3C40_25910 [Planctomycetota bacterium]|nr:hypothetical protein [Planctomycetota bacterium]
MLFEAADPPPVLLEIGFAPRQLDRLWIEKQGAMTVVRVFNVLS